MFTEEKPPIFIITGIMASGKSTVGEALARRFPRAVHLRGDIFRRMIVSGREEMSPNASPEAYHQLRLRFQLAASAAIDYQSAGFVVILQDNYLGREMHTLLAALNAASPLLLITLNPDVETIANARPGAAKPGITPTPSKRSTAFLPRKIRALACGSTQVR